MNKKLNFEPKWFVVIVFFLVGAFLGSIALFIWIFNKSDNFGLQKIHPAKSLYQYINPLLAVDTNEKKEFFENQILKNNAENIFQKAEKSRTITQYAVYFKDIESGSWMGINADIKFSPGIFLKVPIMISYLKNAEFDTDFLKKTLVYKKNVSAENDILNGNLEYGKQYSVDELIKEMIINDDDDATSTLFDNINKASLNDVFSDLGIDFKEDNTSTDFISVKLYTLIFRVLYNATYLNRIMSEKALEILSSTNVDEGIARSLPNDLPVAHKYRTRKFNNGINAVESHDCGIVYYPDHSYALCVMAIGQNPDVINSIFNEISMAVYNYMNNKYQLRKEN